MCIRDSLNNRSIKMSKLVKQTENELKIIIENAVNKAMASGDLPQAEIPQFNICLLYTSRCV